VARRGAGAGADLRPPGPEADPREGLRWSRRGEIFCGLGAIAFGIAFWNEGWWHWLLIGVGVFGVLPLWGPAAILRRAERDPSILVSDPQRRRERGRRASLAMVPAAAAIGALIGFAGGGWRAAALVGVLTGVSAALGAWWVWHPSK
jgi:hypothetical protein